jgi:hypothetical protein
MNCREPLKTSAVNFDKIVYPKIKNNQSKKLVLIKYNDKSKLSNFVFQTPTLHNLFKPQINGNYADVEIALKGKEQGKANKFIEFLNSLEQKIKEDAQHNASRWFDLRDNPMGTIKFQKIIRDSENHPEGTIKLKIIKNNDFDTVLQMNNNRRINMDAVPEDSWCKMILECYGIWINSNNDFGLFFRPILISYTPKEKNIYNYKLIDDSDEDVVDIPDTEINQNIFMKIEQHPKQNNDSTSQLEYSELMKELEQDEIEQNTSDIKLSVLKTDDLDFMLKQNVDLNLEVNVNANYESDSDSSDSSDTNNTSDSSNDVNNNVDDTDDDVTSD